MERLSPNEIAYPNVLNRKGNEHHFVGHRFLLDADDILARSAHAGQNYSFRPVRI